MRRWFLSYHAPEQALAERLKSAIERKDSGCEIFFAPSNLRAGGSWSAQLAEEIERATAFILLVGDSGIGNWQVPEYDEALDKWVRSPAEFTLIMMLLEGQTAPGLPFLRRLHWIVTADPASDQAVARLFEASAGDGGNPRELWRYASPYRGLEAMEEKDSDYFFGRKRETTDVLSALAAAADRLPILIGNSGVGKSSLAQAGVLAALKRQAWPDDDATPPPWPAAFDRSRQWCFLSLRPGTEPLKSLIDCFLDTWQLSATDPERVKRQHGWLELLGNGKATLSDLIAATERRREELDQPLPPGFFLYIDQGEELYVRAALPQRRRFSELIAGGLSHPRLRAMMSLRSDFLGHLQSDEALFKSRHHIDVPPLREAELREIVSRPAQILAARFESERLIDIITRRTVEDSIKDVGALPLLSYTLDDMWSHMVRQGDGTLRLPAQSFELGGVLVERADRFLAEHRDAEDALRRILTLRLATVREDGEPTRRRADRSEFSNEEWRLVSELADYPNRLLVTVGTETGQTYAEVAHEAIFRRWDKLRQWIAQEREFLSWHGGLESARRAWQAAPQPAKHDAVLMGLALTQAERWLSERPGDIPAADRDFIAQSRAAAQRRRLRVQALVAAVALGEAAIIFIGLLGWLNRGAVEEQWRFYTAIRPYVAAQITPYVLSAAAEQVLKPGDSFRECAKDCPDMIVIPAGSFTMGSPASEAGRGANEGPQRTVTIAKPFAVAKFELTFAAWDACAAYGDCDRNVSDSGWGRGQSPLIDVTWNDAQQYVRWLSKTTGKPYRLLSEAEFEYAARAGTQTAYYWGDQIGTGNADCDGCGSMWDNKQTVPVGSFKPNAFGLYDMAGNVWQWVEDCLHPNYQGAPADGSAWTQGVDCTAHMDRGGSWRSPPTRLRSAARNWYGPLYLDNGGGFRVARALAR
jgi:formylglycine-generating enzyme required for sulfatase activity